MKKLVYIFSLLILNSNTFSQNELVNVFNSYSEVYGGTEDSGIQRSESFIFIASATIGITDVTYKEGKLLLHKGDSLVVNVSKNIPYARQRFPYDTSEIKNDLIQPEVLKQNRFKVVKVGNIYYLNVQFPYVWPGTIEYIYRKKKYISKVKEGFDKGFTGYAP